MTDAVAALRLKTHGERGRPAQTRQTATLGDLVKGTASPDARLGYFEAALERHRTDFRFHDVALPLLLVCVFCFGLTADFVIRFLDGPASNSAPPAMELLPRPLPNVAPE